MPYLLVLVVLGIPTLLSPFRTNGWYWDFAQAFGYLGLAGVLILFLSTGRRINIRHHQLLSYAVLTVIGLHVGMLYAYDSILWLYLTPSAPAYMWIGVVCVLIYAGILILSTPSTRRYWHNSHAEFRQWHVCLSVLVAGTTLWHSWGAGFYLSQSGGYLLAVVAGSTVIFRLLNKPTFNGARLNTVMLTAAALLAVGTFVGLRQF